MFLISSVVLLPQITFLTNAKDKERLDLLKEVAGTTLYDEKKAESLKTLEAAGSREPSEVVLASDCLTDVDRFYEQRYAGPR